MKMKTTATGRTKKNLFASNGRAAFAAGCPALVAALLMVLAAFGGGAANAQRPWSVKEVVERPAPPVPMAAHSMAARSAAAADAAPVLRDGHLAGRFGEPDGPKPVVYAGPDGRSEQDPRDRYRLYISKFLEVQKN